MKAILITLLSICSFNFVSAQDADKIKELELRIQKLEVQVAKLQQEHTAGSQQADQVQKMRKIAREHERAERMNFKPEDIAQAEKLYQEASRMLSDDRSKKLLDSVVAIYPQLNRAGCAQLYRAQQETGPEKELLLKDCIKRFSNCYYLDGTQVGPLAMLQLAYYYQETNRKQEAGKLFKKIRNENPEAVNHDGALLIDEMD